jgi:hypothetical protein
MCVLTNVSRVVVVNDFSVDGQLVTDNVHWNSIRGLGPNTLPSSRRNSALVWQYDFTATGVTMDVETIDDKQYECRQLAGQVCTSNFGDVSIKGDYTGISGLVLSRRTPLTDVAVVPQDSALRMDDDAYLRLPGDDDEHGMTLGGAIAVSAWVQLGAVWDGAVGFTLFNSFQTTDCGNTDACRNRDDGHLDTNGWIAIGNDVKNNRPSDLWTANTLYKRETAGFLWENARDNWVMVSVSISGGRACAYLNGVLRGECGTAPQIPRMRREHNYIGAPAEAPYQRRGGKTGWGVSLAIAEFHLFDRGMSAYEVSYLFDRPPSDCCISSGVADAFGVNDIDLTNQVNQAMHSSVPSAVTIDVSDTRNIDEDDVSGSQPCISDTTSTAARVLDVCSETQTWTGCSGTIRDGVGPYGNLLDCRLHLHGQKGTTYTLTFDEFATEEDLDVLHIYDGDSIEAPVLERLSGRLPPRAIVSTGPSLYLQFTTNDKTQALGFTLTFACTGTPVEYWRPLDVATPLMLSQISETFKQSDQRTECFDGTLLSVQCCADATQACANARVTEVVLPGRSLRGSVPDAIGSLTALRSLKLQNNFLTGTLPSTLGRLHLLRELQISHNQMEMQGRESLSNILGGLMFLRTLDLGMSSERVDLTKTIIQPTPPLTCRVGADCSMSMVTRAADGSQLPRGGTVMHVQKKNDATATECACTDMMDGSYSCLFPQSWTSTQGDIELALFANGHEFVPLRTIRDLTGVETIVNAYARFDVIVLPLQCNQDHSYPNELGAACVCEDGYYRNEFEGGWSCGVCDRGQEPNEAGNDCQQCPSGKYSSTGASCELCQVGSYSLEGRSECEACQPGWEPNTERDDCAPCPRGTYSNAGTSCESCPEGLVPNNQGGVESSSCEACQPGEEPNTERDDCAPCPQGTYSNAGTSCESCSQGSVPNNQGEVGSSFCEACGRGQEPVDGQCAECVIGQHSEVGLNCTTCPPGEKPNQNHGAWLCAACAPGEEPDELGYQCVACPRGTFSEAGRSCTGCTTGMVPDQELGAESCILCGRGEQPDEEGIQCLPCPRGTFSSAGGDNCTTCPPGKQPNGRSGAFECDSCDPVSTANVPGMMCEPCPAGQEADKNRTKCVCPTNWYNASYKLRCIDEHYQGSLSILEESLPPDTCVSCDELPCVSCNCTEPPCAVQMQPGWSDGRVDDDSATTKPWFIFQCATEEDTCLNVYENIVNSTTSTLVRRCETGHGGALCNICEPGYSMNSDALCEECGLMATHPGIFLALVLFVMSVAWLLYRKTPERLRAKTIASARVLYQPGRILIGYAQVVNRIGFVLNISLPPWFVTIKRFLSSLSFDLNLGLDCFDSFGFDFYDQWLVSVFFVPIGLVAVCVLHYLKQCKCRSGVPNTKRTELCAQDDMQANLFLVMFLLYPGICNKLFNIFTCRTLDPSSDVNGAERSLLYVDFRVDCNEDPYNTYMYLALVTIAGFALGVPLWMVVHMVRHFTENNLSSDGDRFVTRRVADELNLDDEQAKDAIRDVAQGGGYPFLVNAFRTPYFYWEGIDMLRKLSLVGLLVMCGRGSALQLFVGLLLSIVALLLQVHLQPFRHPEDNAFKTAVDANICLLIAVCFALRDLEQTEASELETVALKGSFELTAELLDAVLIGSFLVTIVGGFIWAVWRKQRAVRDLLRSWDETEDETATKRHALQLLNRGIVGNDHMKLLQEYFEEMDTMVNKWSHVFISYRVASDEELARQLYDALSSTILETGQTIRVYLDQVRLEDGQRWDKGFMEGLAKSWVFVPIVSVGAVSPMLKLSKADDFCDNVLLEWTAALELHMRGTIKAVLPVLVAENESFFTEAKESFGGLAALPAHPSSATMGQVLQHLQDTTEDDSIAALLRLVKQASGSSDPTVQGVVSSLLKFQGAKLSHNNGQTTQHGHGSAQGADLATVAKRVQGTVALCLKRIGSEDVSLSYDQDGGQSALQRMNRSADSVVGVSPESMRVSTRVKRFLSTDSDEGPGQAPEPGAAKWSLLRSARIATRKQVSPDEANTPGTVREEHQAIEEGTIPEEMQSTAPQAQPEPEPEPRLSFGAAFEQELAPPQEVEVVSSALVDDEADDLGSDYDGLDDDGLAPGETTDNPLHPADPRAQLPRSEYLQHPHQSDDI